MVAVPCTLFVSLVLVWQQPTAAVRPDGPVPTRPTLVTTAKVVNPRGFVETSRSTPACDDFKSFEWENACSVDEFLEHAWVIALSVDCQLAKGQNILDAAAEEVYQADKRHQEGLQTNAPLPTLKTLTECPASQCETCAGLLYGSSQDGRGVLLFPSPTSEGTTYAYDGERRVLNNRAEVTSVQPAIIDAAMQYAFLHGYAINYSNQEHYFLSPGIQEELRFVGHDPQMVVTMQPHSANASTTLEDMCVGAAVGRLIDLPSYEMYFSSTGRVAVEPEEAHSFWSEAHPDADGSSFKVTGSKVAVDATHKPVGTVHLDIDVDHLVQTYLEPRSLAPDVYAFLVDSEGRILGANENTFAVLFNTQLTREKFRNPDDETICKRKDRNNALRSCTFQTPRSLDLTEVLRKESFSQANFTGILAQMFGEPNRDQTMCSKKVGESQVHFPQTNLNHTIAFCSFGTFPSWGLIFGTARGSFAGAAEIVVNATKLYFDIRTQEGYPRELADLPSPQFLEVSTEGNVRLDFEIELPHSFVIAKPAFGTISRGEKVVVQLAVTQESYKKWLDYRIHNSEERVDTGIATATTMKDVDEVFTQVYVKPDRDFPRASCFNKPGTVSILLRNEVALTNLSLLVKAFGKTMACILAIILVALLMYFAWKMLKKLIRRMEEEQATLQRARESVHQLSFPMALVSFETFKTWKRLISHEDAEARHHLIWLYTTDEVSDCFESKYIVFVSHQWTSFTEPDPERPDAGGHVQYNAMVMSIESVIQKNNVKLDHKDIYVWVDYACIPQKHRGLQTLAIHSLTVYAANVHAFVVVAPRVEHANLVTDEGTCVYCDKDSYQGRAWCRAEQLSHILARGRKNMYLAEGDKLNQLEDEWLDQSIMVFAGDMTCCRLKHEGMEKCDKQRLVVPMLGLYAQLCRTCADIEYVKDPVSSTEQPEGVEDVMAAEEVEEEEEEQSEDVEDLGEELQAIKAKIDSQLHTVFPPRFVLKKGRTEKEVELFGGLVEKVRDQSYESDPSQSALDGKDGDDDDDPDNNAKVTVPPLRTGGNTNRSTRPPLRTGQPSRSSEPPPQAGAASGAATAPKP